MCAGYALSQAGAGLSDQEFQDIVDVMMTTAQDKATIAALTAMAAEFAGGAPPQEVRACAGRARTATNMDDWLLGTLSRPRDAAARQCPARLCAGFGGR